MIGNGEVVTTLGPTGYHTGHCPERELVNRTIFWAGRRLRDARDANIRIPRVAPDELIGVTRPLVRLGRLDRRLSIDGLPMTDEVWSQTLDLDRGAVVSTLTHGEVEETTRSLVCLTENLLVFHTRLTNTGSAPKQIDFTVEYAFGDAEGFLPPATRLRVRRPYPEDIAFGDVEGVRATDDVASRPPHLRESLSVDYEVQDELGGVHLGRYPVSPIETTERGGRIPYNLTLEVGASFELWVWATVSDRIHYTYFPEFEQVQELVEAHEAAWADFWRTGRVTLGNDKLEALYRASLYTMRSNTSPWTIPPGYLSTHWEGRVFHDDFYCFLGMISSGHLDLAERPPNFRLITLPVALRRGTGHGAFYGWEVTEDGEEGAPYGHWTDERFGGCQFTEECWRYYLFTHDREALARYYPVMKGCAEWLIYDMLIRDAAGQLVVRPTTDFYEVVFPVTNSIFLASGIVRTLLNASRAAELLDVDGSSRRRWRQLAAELRANLPVDEEKDTYKFSDDTPTRYIADYAAMVYPFSFDVFGERAARTLDAIASASEEERDWTNWLWMISQLSTTFFYQGRADEGYVALNTSPSMTGPFMAPNEHYQRDIDDYYLPWLTTGAGAYVHSVCSMFVQVLDEDAPVLLPALPGAAADARFKRLLASPQVWVSGEVRGGRLVSLSAESDTARPWACRLPRRFADGTAFAEGAKVSNPDEHGRVTLTCDLAAGVTALLA
jgi:hypothetical protein